MQEIHSVPVTVNGEPPATAGMPVVPREVLDAEQAALDRLAAQNEEDRKQLQLAGFGFNAEQIINGRIDTVIAAVAAAIGPQGELWAIQCKMSFEKAMAQNIAQAKEGGVAAQLAQGAAFSPAQIHALARQVGFR
jgi:hypothetical protein